MTASGCNTVSVTACEICRALEPHLSADTESGFPAELAQLQDISCSNYRDEILRQCPSCGSLYEYRQWTPGGSDDAMRTYVHESLLVLNPFLAELWFADSIAEVRQLVEQGYRFFDETLKSLEQQLQKLRAANAGRAGEVVRAGERFLQAVQVPEFSQTYRAQVMARKERAEKIIALYRSASG